MCWFASVIVCVEFAFECFGFVLLVGVGLVVGCLILVVAGWLWFG